MWAGPDLSGEPASMWCGPGSNRRHKDFQSFALPTELPHHSFTCDEETILDASPPKADANIRTYPVYSEFIHRFFGIFGRTLFPLSNFTLHAPRPSLPLPYLHGPSRKAHWFQCPPPENESDLRDLANEKYLIVHS